VTLQGAAVVITGGARGLGKAIAEAFSARGANVGLMDLREADLRETAKALAGKGTRVLTRVADITRRTDSEDAARYFETELGRIDVLVNNAGTFSVVGPAWEVDPDLWFRDVTVNLYGTFLVCRAFLPTMVRTGSGYLINMASSGGVIEPHAFASNYATSKVGIVRYSESLSIELKQHGVKVFSIGPPAVMSDMTRFLLEDENAKRWRPGLQEIFDQKKDFPPDIVSNLVLELVSGKADTLSGKYFLATHDLADILARSAHISGSDELTLRIRGEPPGQR
jgi:NAD(P)-dependent dehydrogenase (short-subunit alcohol dehydrogenase family)